MFGSRRIWTVWFTSTAARGSIVLASIGAAIGLADSGVAIALVGLAAVGYINTLASFIAAAADSGGESQRATLDGHGRAQLAAIASIAGAVTAAATEAGPAAAAALMLALLIQNWVTYERQIRLLDGELWAPYSSLVVRNAGLTVGFIIAGSHSLVRQTTAVSLVFVAAGIVEFGAQRIAGRRHYGMSALPTTRVPTTLVLGYSLSCVLPWLLRVATAIFSSVAALRVLEYADRTTYLAVSSVLGGLAIELQRRWQAGALSPTQAHAEGVRFALGLGSIGVMSGFLAAVLAPVVLESPSGGDIVAVLTLGLVAGGLGAITIAQRLAIVIGDHASVGRHTLWYQAAGAVGVLGLAPFGLSLSALAMAAASWALAVQLLGAESQRVEK